ncbi:MAG: ATP-binding cassette domain-containing protein [Actinomycetota bacterium]|nr:ATP-binding cassette domain-containing protein [Actinomycetota bacterium]
MSLTAPVDPQVPVEVRGLTKRFGAVVAVDNLTFSVQPGRVTGFLGPNGAGKTTTLRMALGLVAPTAGTATVGGLPYADLVAPQRIVGAALEATGFHPGRSGRNHLRVLAATAGVDDRRVDEVLAMVGLTDAAKRRSIGYSLGMRQRLGLAGALLADPRVLLLDEPANGLDPEGIAWLRGFLRHLAAQGRTILVSSHVLSEVQQTVDDVVIIARGRLVRASTLTELEGAAVVVARSPRAVALVDVLRSSGLDATSPGVDLIRVATPDAALVGHAAYGASIELHELRAEASDLERIFLELTGGPE